MYIGEKSGRQTMKGKSSVLTATPPPIRRPEKYDEGETSCNDTQKERELQIISTSTFTLPDDWIVEEKPRRFINGRSKNIDKYYYEPGTGRKFRSLISVKRYLYGEGREVLSTERVKSENENAIERRTGGTTSFFKLPDDRIVEEKPRTNINNARIVKRSYIEPGTGQRFHSLRAVERYLNKENKSGCGKQRATGKNCSLKAASNCSTIAEEAGVTPKTIKLAVHSQEEINWGKDSKASIREFSNPPEKVNWVVSGWGGAWRPFLNDSEVPESVKLKWSEAFFQSINAGDRVAPNCWGL